MRAYLFLLCFGLLALCLFSNRTLAQGPSLVGAEYFFNADPGFGNGTALSFTQGPNPQVEGTINVGELPRGFHRLSVRFQNQANEWSFVSTRVFYIDNEGFSEMVLVDYVEYFFDKDDPGLGQAIEIPLEAAASAIDLEELIVVAALEEGEHTISVRIRDNKGLWSIPETREFTVGEPTPGDPPQPDLETLPDLNTECEFNFGSLMIPTATAADGSTILGTTDESIFPINQQGITVIVWTYTDANGLESTQEQRIILEDLTPPVIEGVEDMVVETDPGNCSLTIAIVPPTALDDCSVESLIGTRSDELPLDAPFPVGITVIKWVASDVFGNVSLPIEQEIQVVEKVHGPTSPGSLDLSFLACPNEGANGTVLATVVQPDGKVLIGGDFTSVNGISRNRIARLHEDGSLDSSFDPGAGASHFVEAIALQADGKVLIVGQFSAFNGTTQNLIARLNEDGSLDTSFNPGLRESGRISGISIQRDGKILIGGDFSSFDWGSNSKLVRLHVDGGLDTTFDVGTGPDGWVFSVGLQEDGSILVGGIFTSFDGVPRNNLARLNSDGRLDTTFDPGPVPGSNDDNEILSIAIQPDGKILIAGFFTSYQGLARRNLARLNWDGSMDVSFDPGNVVGNRPSDITVQADGRILISGNFSSDNGIPKEDIVRLYANGRLDPTFEPGWLVNGAIQSMSLQADGKILLGGTFTEIDGVSRNRIARIFGGVAIEPSHAPVPNLEVLPDLSEECAFNFGSLVIPTATASNGSTILGTTDESIFPLTQQGIIPIVWIYTDANGLESTQEQQLVIQDLIPPTVSVPADIMLEADPGECFASGVDLDVPDTADNCGVESIVNNAPDVFPLGSTDVTWIVTDVNGNAISLNQIVTVVDNEAPTLNSIDNIVVETATGVCSISLEVIPPDAFDNCSVTTVTGTRSDSQPLNEPYPVGLTSITWEATDHSGNVSLPVVQEIQVVENTNGPTSPGSLDLSFLGCPNEGANRLVRTSVIQPDGKIIVGGDFTTYNGIARNRIARINVDGSLDNTFDPGLGADDEIWSVVLQSDGKILVGGRFFTFNGLAISYIVRLNPNGSLDTTFKPGMGTFTNAVLTIALQSDGKIIIGGLFDTSNGSSKNYIARLNQDGTLDSSFNSGTGPAETVRTVSIQEDGKIIIGGLMTSYNGISLGLRGIARINPDGSLDTSFKPPLADAFVTSSVIQPDGKIIIMGSIRFSDLEPTYAIARLNPDGNPDPSFNLLTSETGSVEYSVLQDNGEILIGGDIGVYQNTTINNFARLNPNGSLDTSFNPGMGSSGIVRTIGIQPDGNIFIGGGFTSYDGIARGRVARIFGGGTIPTKLPPTPDENVLPDLTAECLVDFGSLKPPTATANDGSKVVGVTDEKIFPISQQGTTVITWTFTDENGLESTQTQNIEINDLTPPIILLPAEIIVAANQGECFATGVDLGVPETKDNCAIESLTNDAPEVFPLGTTVVTWTATDPSGNESTQRFNVVVEDREAPSISAPADITINMALGSPGASNISLGNPVVSDNCGDPAVSNNAPEVFPPGLTVVLWIAEDAAGNRATAEQRITVTVEQAPVLPTIQAPAAILATTDPGSCGATGLDLGMPQVSGDLAADAISNDAPSVFTIGTTLVTWTLRDRAGNTVTAQQEVVVQDTERPIFLPTEDIRVDTPMGVCTTGIQVTPPQATDNCTIHQISGTRSDGLALTDPYPVGLTSVTWVAIDGSGNASEPFVQDIEVVEDYAIEASPGRLDLSFSTVASLYSDERWGIFSIALQADGKILVGGYSLRTNQIRNTGLVRLNSDGSLDESFTISSNFRNFWVRSIVLQTDGKILVGGDGRLGASSFDRSGLVRLNSDGSIDETFNSVQFRGSGHFVRAIEVLSNGKIQIIGGFGSINGIPNNGIARLNEDGTLDMSFVARFSSPFFQSMTQDNQGRVYVGGRFVSDSHRNFVRLNEDGSIDADFNPSAQNELIGGLGNTVFNIFMRPDGKIDVGGSIGEGHILELPGTKPGFITRLQPDGYPDISFRTPSIEGGALYSSVLQNNGKIIIGGNFSSVNGTPVQGIARLNSDGSLDHSFRPPSEVGIRAATIQSDGKILIGGIFLSFPGVSDSPIARFYLDPCLPEVCTIEINPQDVVLRLNSIGRATLRVEDVISAAASHCQNDELQFHLSQTVFTCGDLGDNLVTLRVVSEDGSESDAAFNVRIIDDTPPAIDEMRPLAALKRPDKSYKLPDFTSIYKATDNCGVMTYTQQPEPGTLIEEPGNYQLIFAATDVNGNMASVEVTLYLREREEDWFKSFESIRDRGVIIVPWGTQFSAFSETRLASSGADGADEEIQVNWNPDGYNPLVPGLYTLSGKVNAKSSYQGEEELELHVLVGKKPLPEDILISNDKLTHRMKAGGVIGSLSTLDPIDDIHSYALDEHPEVFLEKGELVWKGAERPPALTKVNVHSTDRAGQTISRELTLYRDRDLPIDVTVYPNPALLETNLFVQFPEPAEVSIRVFDAAGRLIYQERDRRERSFTRVLDLRGYSQGMYQILVQVDNQLLTRKFVKQ